ncbi:M28 family peptidase [Maribacter halichondriae]|uniref:M28 family peptidase n=1 Tax=Maribacter halichondriae TaxID=2980554 RepID=UPI002359512E|nr:M28 family peptidase [Maribacter sp. Hal144]
MIKKFFTTIITLLCFAFGHSQKYNTDEYFELVRPLYTGELAYETVDFVEDYWRVAGNTGFNKTVYRIAEKLEEAGYVLEEKAAETDRLTYRIEKRPMENPTWEPVSATVRIEGQDTPLLEQSTNRNMVYLNSVSTPKEGVTAEVIYIKNPEDLKNLSLGGKIVFIEGSAGPIFEEAIINQKALGIITYSNPEYLQPEKNTTSIQFRSFGYQENNKAWGIALSNEAKEKLKAALEKGKVELEVNIQTKIYPSEELTIVADVKGTQLPNERLVFSAHIQEPGANDNASGVGVQLEMAVLTGKLIKDNKIDINRTLTYLWGDEIISTHRYIQEDKDRAKDIKWGISLDMVGENTAITGGSFLIEKMPDPSAIWTRGKDKHTEWGGEVMKLEDMKPHYLNDFMFQNFKKQGEFTNWEVNTNPFEGGSDHMPFLDADIPGLLLWHFTDQFYHTDNDRINKVSKETLKNVGTGALMSAFTLLNADTETAIEVLNTISVSAQKRMKEEFDLSKNSIENGNRPADEIKILKAWEDWYLKAMETTKDLEKKPSIELVAEVLAAQNMLRLQAKYQIKVLR